MALFITHALTRIAYDKIKNVMNMKKQGVVASYFCHLIWHWNMKKLAALNCLERTPVVNISFILYTGATAGLTKTTGVWKADFPLVKPGQAQDRCESSQETSTCGSQEAAKEEAVGWKHLNVVGRPGKGGRACRPESSGWHWLFSSLNVHLPRSRPALSRAVGPRARKAGGVFR